MSDEQQKSESPNEDDRIRDAKRAVDREYLNLGRELYLAFSSGKYKSDGFTSFDNYAIARGVEAGRANRLRRVFKKFSKDLGVPFSLMLELGYERVKAIERVINRGNRAFWLQKAAELDYPELVKLVREKKPPRRRRKEVHQDAGTQKQVYQPEDASKLVAAIQDDRLKPSADGSVVTDDDIVYVKKLYLIGSQNMVFETAIENMERRTGSHKVGYLLTSALEEFLAHEATRGLGDDDRLRYFMGVLERRYKGKLLWFKDKRTAERAAEILKQAEQELQKEAESAEEAD